MAVLTYNDYLRNLLGKTECILAFDTAADFLGLTNGGYRDKAQIFVLNEQPVPDVEQIKLQSFAEKEYQKNQGLMCTTINQTIVDLLEQNGDEQIITESLANYYEEHGESFSELLIPESLQERFAKYSEWAISYYEE